MMFGSTGPYANPYPKRELTADEEARIPNLAKVLNIPKGYIVDYLHGKRGLGSLFIHHEDIILLQNVTGPPSLHEIVSSLQYGGYEFD